MTIATKQCSCCGSVKSIEDFQVRKMSNDGRTASCRECLKKRDRARYPKERVARAEMMRSYLTTESGRAAARRAKRGYAERYPGRKKANIALNNAIRDGRVARDPCHICGAVEVEGHHADYSRQLDVTWLCIEHHNQLHNEHAAHLREIAKKEQQ